jgi:FlaA1/EpsC-like NDP-sugar epimerase
VRVFITGLTGTLGTALARLHHERGDRVWGCARNESRAVEWIRENREVATLFCCDAEALTRLETDAGKMVINRGIDRLYHLAAMKHVDLCEENPDEAITQNVYLTSEVASVCRQFGILFVLASTDKACLPTGVYGATKLLAEKIALREGGAVVRLGNLIGSSGSVFRLWKEALARGERIKLTDPDMTRFFIPVDEAAEFVADSLTAGVVNAPGLMKSVRMGTVALKLTGGVSGKIDFIGSRPGEEVHQRLWPGHSSFDATRWDIDELLREAGVQI